MNDQEQQLTALAQAMIQLQQLDEAAENGNKQAEEIMKAIRQKAQDLMAKQSQGTAMEKCGGRLKKKETGGIMADKCGSRMKKKEIGGLVRKAECGCRHLKRIGGKLVTINCNGDIIK